jgi:hypothetical protein
MSDKYYKVGSRGPGGTTEIESLSLQETLTPRLDWWSSGSYDRTYLLTEMNSRAIGYLASVVKEKLDLDLNTMLNNMCLPNVVE